MTRREIVETPTGESITLRSYMLISYITVGAERRSPSDDSAHIAEVSEPPSRELFRIVAPA